MVKTPEILIVGQGLAGTLLGWEFERAGIPFQIVDPGHAGAASRIAAGIVNPITGRRLVKTAGIEQLLPAARVTYREIEAALGVRLWRDVRIRRILADERERRIFAERQAKGDLAPYLGAAEADGFWIEGAGRVDLPVLLSAMRERWLAARVMSEAVGDTFIDENRCELVIDCTGRATRRFDFVPWEFSKGEILTVKVEGLDPDVILNRGHWVLPIRLGEARVGATHEAGCIDLLPTTAGRTALEASAATLLARPFEVVRHEAGVRVNLPDRQPVAGRHPVNARLGAINGLGAKGVHLAPWLARQWVNHLTEGVPFSPAIDIARFWHRRSSHA